MSAVALAGPVIPAGMDLVVLEAVAAMEGGDWDTLKPLLHPYLHWTGPEWTLCVSGWLLPGVGR